MKIAFDKVNVTPNQPCFMAGYSRREKSQGVLDPIEINTVAAEIGNEVYILGILDSIMVEESFCAAYGSGCQNSWDCLWSISRCPLSTLTPHPLFSR